jgi:hypothetical protein
MASGSQTYNGICADLPVAPRNRSRVAPSAPWRRRSRPNPGRAARPSTPLPEIQRAERPEEQEHAQNEPEVTDAIENERLLAGFGGRRLREPEADQQVRTEADAFPPDEQHGKVRAQHEHQHETGEQVEIGKVARVLGVRFVVHVRDRVQVNQRPDAADHEHHHCAERVEPERQRNLKRPRRKPGVIGLRNRANAADRFETNQVRHRRDADAERQEHGARGQQARHPPGQAAANGGVDQEPGERKQRNQEQQHAITT